MPPVATPAHPNAREHVSVSTGGRRSRPADEVTLLTALQFAKSAKSSQSTAREQEEHLSDVLVLIRHGERQDHADRAWKGNALLPLHDPPLSNAGRKQSFETALKYFALRQEKKVEQRINGTFTLFLVSPFHRCIETAAIMNVVAFEGRLPMYVDPLLADWQQAKVFRTPPVLGGAYATCEPPRTRGAAGDGLCFRLQLESLRATLVPFLKSRAAEELALLGEYGISAAVASSWAALAEGWLDVHTSLPVWTCAAVASAISDRLANTPSAASVSERGAAQRPSRGGASSPPTKSETGAAAAATDALFRGCGVVHPEGKSDLVRRCELVMHTHFLRGGATQPESMVPWAVQKAVEVEQRTRLPKYFQTWLERTPEDRDAAGPPALLPPMHVMAVTHADVVSTLLEVCCPKYHDKGAGYSVPYCSITALHRHNNFYRIPTAEERQRLESSVCATASAAKGGKGRAKKKGNTLSPKTQVVAPVRTKPLPPLSVEWEVDSVGSTDLLRTRIVIQYTK